MSLVPQKDYPVKWIPVGEISVVWAESQRPISERKVKQIMEEFDPDALGVLIVTMPNGNGVYHCIDGQNRAEAVRRLWGDKERVPCTVLSTRNPGEAAHIFRVVNGTRSKPSAIDMFRVGVTAKYEAETAINDLLKALGYRVGLDGSDGVVSCVTKCIAVYRKHGIDTLEAALLLIRGTWGKARDSVQGGIITGYAELVARYRGQIDGKRLQDKVSKKYTPARFLGAARQAKDFSGGTISEGVLRMLINTYNAGLAPEKRLPLDDA